MSVTRICVKESGFSLRGFLYYKKNQKKFTEKSIAKLLTTREEKWTTKSITGAIKLVLNVGITVKTEKREEIYKVVPEMELRENDIIIIPFPMGSFYYQVKGNRLISI